MSVSAARARRAAASGRAQRACVAGPEPVELGADGPDALPLDMPLAVAARSVAHESYWRRRSEARAAPRWVACDPTAHGGSWKALFFERRTAELLSGEGEAAGEAPMSADALRWELALAAPFVRHLELRPPAPGTIDYALLFEVLGRRVSFLRCICGAAASARRCAARRGQTLAQRVDPACGRSGADAAPRFLRAARCARWHCVATRRHAARGSTRTRLAARPQRS